MDLSQMFQFGTTGPIADPMATPASLLSAPAPDAPVGGGNSLTPGQAQLIGRMLMQMHGPQRTPTPTQLPNVQGMLPGGVSSNGYGVVGM